MTGAMMAAAGGMYMNWEAGGGGGNDTNIVIMPADGELTITYPDAELGESLQIIRTESSPGTTDLTVSGMTVSVQAGEGIYFNWHPSDGGFVVTITGFAGQLLDTFTT